MAELFNQTTTNIQEKSNLIWSVADLLRDYYKPHEYGKVILPFCVLKRFNDCLIPTKDKVLETYENVKHLEVKAGFLERASGYSFYNISKYDFKKLTEDATHIEDNFRNYIMGYSENVQDILENYDFDNEIKKLSHNGLLFLVIEAFNKPQAYMGADKITSVDMGYIFEDLIKRFSESYDEQAGAHFTSRDIIYLMTDILISEDKDLMIEEGVAKTVYDMTMGTSQMLTCMTERLTALDAEADVRCFGQELNPETFAIAKSSALIHGGNADNMKLGNTLSDDKFKDYKFDYIISNPPFGIVESASFLIIKAYKEENAFCIAGSSLSALTARTTLFPSLYFSIISKIISDGSCKSAAFLTAKSPVHLDSPANIAECSPKFLDNLTNTILSSIFFNSFITL